jgi:hypothetical protein
MVNRVTEILIGKDINRDAQVIAGIDMTTLGASTGLADGEIVVLDKNLLVLAEGATVADTDKVFIAQGTGSTFSITNEAGTITTGNKRIIISNPVEAAGVKSYLGEAYTVKVEQTWLLDIDDIAITPVVGTEYVLRLVYSDITEYPTRFTQSYRWVATAATEGALIWAFGLAINNHKHSRVTAVVYQSDGSTPATSASNANQLYIAAKEIPQCTSTLNDIDVFDMVRFTLNINYVNSAGNEAALIAQSDGTDVDNVTGHGNWEQVRDTEKYAMGYEGVTNVIHFPIIKPDFRTVVDATYHQIVIDHNPSHLSPYISDKATDQVTTILAFVVPSSGTQLTDVLAQLNPWMASCPGAFSNITF